MCFAPQRHALFRDLNFQKLSEPPVFLTCWLPNVFRATTACTFSTSQFPKVVRSWCVLYMSTTACTFSSSQLPKMVRNLCTFWIFDFEMCFALQRRALFHHLNFQKSSEPGVFCTFWLGNVLRATTRRFSESTFDPPERQIIGKNTGFRDFPTCSRTWIFFLLRLSL